MSKVNRLPSFTYSHTNLKVERNIIFSMRTFCSGSGVVLVEFVFDKDFLWFVFCFILRDLQILEFEIRINTLVYKF